MTAGVSQPAAAQTSSDWKVSIYPAFVWVPLGVAIDVDVPPFDGGGAGGGGKIAEGRFDGAFFGGVSAEKGKFRFDADGLWAGFGGDRPESPVLQVSHFGITAGYSLLYFKLTNELAAKTFTVTQTLHGPVAGIGFYF